MNYFSKDELKCSHCGRYNFDETFLSLLNSMREEAGFPYTVSSGFRCRDHPEERKKLRLGEHQTGKAVDIQVMGGQAMRVLEIALEHGIPRIGINQKGEHGKRFIHLGFNHDFPVPALWSY